MCLSLRLNVFIFEVECVYLLSLSLRLNVFIFAECVYL